MKKIKLLLLISILVICSGCKRDTLEDINIITTYYPIEYVTNYLYGEHSEVASMFPNGTDAFTYELSNKQISDYSSKELLIYTGITNDKSTAYEFLNKNKNLLIIDSSYGMEITYGTSELWLNPSNLLMISQNVKNGLKEYINNSYLQKEIDKKYNELKVKLSELDAELRITGTNATRKTIIVNSDSLKFLEKYGLEVISLDDTNTIISEKTINTVNDLISSETVKHIFILENEKNSDVLNQLITTTKINTITFERLDTIKDEERSNKEYYISIMNKNIEALKSELY